MANRLQSAGTDLDSIFQSYVSGDIVQSTTTNIQNGGTDIKSRYAGRDNKAGNASTAVNFTYGGVALNGLFNKIGATYDVTISGTPTYTGAAQTPTLTHNPTNTPTQATITSQTNAGSYTTANFTITLPGNYLAGTYSGTFTINPATISGTATNPASATYNGAFQLGTVITNVLPAAATYSGSVSASGINAGSYTSSITGTVNYTGTVNGGTFTINRKPINATCTADYGYDSFLMAFIVLSITFGGGVSNDSFSNFTITQTGGSTSDLPIYNVSGTFDASGFYTYSFPSAVFINAVGNVTLRVVASGNYIGSSNCQLFV